MAKSEEQAEKPVLKPQLTTGMLIVLGISSTIGSGIYIVIGIVANDYAGPCVIASFIIAGLVALSNSLAYAELSSRFPGTGALYTYVYRCWGPGLAFIIGWLSILGNMASTSLGAQTFSFYIKSMILNGTIDNLNNTDVKYFTHVLFTEDFDLPASFLITLSTLILLSGTSVLSKLATVTSGITVTSLVVLAVTGLLYGDLENLTDPDHESLAPHGLPGIIHGAAVCYFAYTGFVTVCFSSEETKNPKKAVPIALATVLVFVIFLYVGVTLSVLLMKPYWLLQTGAPLLNAVQYAKIGWTKTFIVIGVTTGLIQVNLLCIYGVSRLVFSMARDGLLIRILQKVSGKTKTPAASLMLCGICCLFFSAMFNFGVLISFTTTVVFVNSIVANLLVIYLRCTAPKDKDVHNACDLNGNLKFYTVVGSEEPLLPRHEDARESTVMEMDRGGPDELNSDNILSLSRPKWSQNEAYVTMVQEEDDKLSSSTTQLTSDLDHDISSHLKIQNRSENNVIKGFIPEIINVRIDSFTDARIQKWYVILAMFFILLSCVFLSLTLILMTLPEVEVAFSDGVAPVLLCAVALVYATFIMYRMRTEDGFSGTKMPLVPFIPIVNIFFDVLMLVILSDSYGSLYCAAAVFVGCCIYGLLLRKSTD